jgi:glycosyltransferase involved in cell wall biosynthesis
MDRKNIGLLFTSGKYWMGGVIYIQNLIHSLNKLNDVEKPNLFVFYNELSKPFIQEIEYPYIEFKHIKSPNLPLGYLISIISQRNIFENGIIKKYKLNGLFPLDHYPVGLGKYNSEAAAWFPDLQHKFYPEYFSKQNLFTRSIRARFILKNSNKLILSSNNVYSHVKVHYKIRKDLKIYILKFTSIIDKNKLSAFDEVKEKYSLNMPYFIVSNQFWKHKDHTTVFKAIKLLKNRNVKCNFIFTGNMEDNRNSRYIQELKRVLLELNISDYTNFIGLVNRKDQLCIMKNSMAVIQPSLFEGWSTVIEDAKALGTQIIASDLPVHFEQLDNGEKGFIFTSQDSQNLSEILIDFVNGDIVKKPIFSNYDEQIINFAKSFLNIFHS